MKAYNALQIIAYVPSYVYLPAVKVPKMRMPLVHVQKKCVGLLIEQQTW